jgi:hypothetical protein
MLLNSNDTDISDTETLIFQVLERSFHPLVKNTTPKEHTTDLLGVFLYWYGPVRSGTRSIRLLVLLGLACLRS